MRERDGEQPVGVDLACAVVTEPRVDRLALEPADDVVHRRVVRGLDLLGRAGSARAHSAETLLTGEKSGRSRRPTP